ncbi:hypothetical protein Tco_0698304 [Tanacetum coccineum]
MNATGKDGEAMDKVKCSTSGNCRAVEEYKLFLTTYAEFDMDPTKLQEGDEGRLMAPWEAFNRIVDVVQ